MPDEIEGQEESVDANLALLVAEAREQLNAQLATVDAQATKSLAITAVDLAGIGLVIASRATLSPWYWAPTITALALSVAALVVPVVTVPIKDGPDLVRFYVSHIRQPPYQAKLAMYELLLQSIDRNRRRAEGWRRQFFWGGIAALALPVLWTIVAVLVVR